MREGEPVFYILKQTSSKSGVFCWGERVEIENVYQLEVDGPMILTATNGDVIPVRDHNVFISRIDLDQEWLEELRGSKRYIEAFLMVHKPNLN